MANSTAKHSAYHAGQRWAKRANPARREAVYRTALTLDGLKINGRNARMEAIAEAAVGQPLKVAKVEQWWTDAVGMRLANVDASVVAGFAAGVSEAARSNAE